MKWINVLTTSKFPADGCRMPGMNTGIPSLIFIRPCLITWGQLFMFTLVESLIGTFPGLIASLLYTYIPYKAVEVYVRGALSEFWAQIFFPLIFWAIYKLVKQGKIKYLLWFGFATAALATTHTLMTMIFAPIAVVWAIYWLVREKWNNLSKVILGGALAFGLSAFFVLPVIFERSFTHIELIKIYN